MCVLIAYNQNRYEWFNALNKFNMQIFDFEESLKFNIGFIWNLNRTTENRSMIFRIYGVLKRNKSNRPFKWKQEEVLKWWIIRLQTLFKWL